MHHVDLANIAATLHPVLERQICILKTRAGPTTCDFRRADCYLALRAQQYHRSTAQRLACELAPSTGRVAARKTLCGRLRQSSLCQRPTVRLPLTHLHRRERLEWHHQHAMWTVEQGTDVVHR